MIIFFGIVLTVYLTVNYYIMRRGLQSLPRRKSLRIAYISVFILLALSYIAGRLFERWEFIDLARIFTLVGAFWIASILYFFLLILFADFLRALNGFFHFFPDFIKQNWQKTKLITFYSIIGITVTIVFFGYVNAHEPVVNNIYIKVDKKVKGMKTLRIAAVSDIHLGIINGKSFVNDLTKRLQKLDADIIVLPGDILDESESAAVDYTICQSFKLLNPKYGIWAVPGNHEYYGGINHAMRFLRYCGIKVLRDNCVEIDEKFYLAGREDYSKNRLTEKARKELNVILKGIDRTKPVILLDHQPINLNDAYREKIDLQISGHTHHGQLWPLNIITNAVYELSYGYMQKGKTHYYVSDGYGTWGPPVRVGNTPEIVLITITFE